MTLILPQFALSGKGIVNVTWLGSSKNESTGSTITYSDVTTSTDGILVVLCTAFADVGRTVSSVRLEGTTCTQYSESLNGNLIKCGVGALSLSAGTYTPSMVLSSTNGSFARNFCGAWLLENADSTTEVDADAVYTSSSATTVTVLLNTQKGGCALYLAGEKAHTSWSGATHRGTEFISTSPTWTASFGDISNTNTATNYSETHTQSSGHAYVIAASFR